AKRAGRDRVHRAGHTTGPLGSVAQGSEVRQRVMDGFVTLLRTADPALDQQSQRAVARAEALANAHDLPVHSLEVLLTASRLLPLRALTGGGTEALEAALAATGVLAQEGRLIGQAAHATPASPVAVRILAVVAGALAYPTAAQAVDALRQPAGSAYDAAMTDALGALEGL
ncbi:MAG: hypothetical protein KC613_16670, partial [Myxococcales bacterium]|nr:hypothetical protein [Myxococcales bacterium]